MTARSRFGAGAIAMAAAVALFGADCPAAPMRADAIAGPYSRMLSQSTDLGPARADSIRIIAALHRPAEPVLLEGWARAHGLTARWRAGDDWAVIEGAPHAVAAAFGVAVHHYRAGTGPEPGRVFYASPEQPGVPHVARSEVSGVGRILGYVPYREALPSPPREVPGGGLAPHQLLNAYNANPLAAEGFTGRGRTVVVFAFDGFQQPDMDFFADSFGLPRFTPEVIGGMPRERTGEASMNLQVIHAIAPDAKLVMVNARPTVNHEGGNAFEKLGALMESVDAQFPGAVWSFSIGWGCDRLFTAADFAPVRAALAAAHRNGTTAFNASGNLAGMECKGGHNWADPPSADDVGVDAVASLPEMTAVGGTKLSTDADGGWLAEQAWYNVPLILGTAGGASSLFGRPQWQDVGPGLPDRRLVPDVAAVADPFTGVRIVFDRAVAVGGGTSQAAPIWAGLATLINDKLVAGGSAPLGDFNPMLYQLAESAATPGFHHIGVGGNAISRSSPAGYDMVTGLGTPNVANLVKNILLARAAS
ncbi:MAG: S53 family peptidase [Mycobacterium sp.]